MQNKTNPSIQPSISSYLPSIDRLLALSLTTLHLICLALGDFLEVSALGLVGDLVARGTSVELPRVTDSGVEALLFEDIDASSLGVLEQVDQLIESLPKGTKHGLLTLLAQLGIEDLLRPADVVDVDHGVL
jgi:hypothetical protein